MRLIIIFSLLTVNLLFANDGFILPLKGKVVVNKKEISKKAKVSFGDSILVKGDSMAIIKLKAGTIIKLKEKSSLKLKKPIIKKGSTLYSFILKFGEVFLRVKKNSNDRVQVKTKSATMGVRGTEFFVSQGGKKLWMCVNEGVVAVSMKKKKGKRSSVLVKAGEGVVVDSDKLPTPKSYEWTKNLNWNFAGNYEKVKDTTKIRDLNYDIKNFEYD